MSKKTRQELKDEGYAIYSEQKARQIIADDYIDTLMSDHEYRQSIVLKGHKGINAFSRAEIEEYFVDNQYIIDEDFIFEWNLEEQQ